jgi:PadR family transcriptional regulator PadR
MVLDVMAKTTNPDFLNGVPELLVLQLLARRSMYGYELVRAIVGASGAVLEFGEGCIYPILHRLESDGLLTSRRETVAGRDRVVYRVTARGRKRLASQTAAWQRIAGAVHQILLGDEHEKPAVT